MSQPFSTGAADIGHQPTLRDGEVVRVTGHPEVFEVVTDPRRFSSAVSRFLQVPNGMDGHEHRTYRAIVNKYFTADRMAGLEPRIREVARQVVAGLPRGVALDFTQDLGYRYAVRVMLAWLGWPRIRSSPSSA